MNVNDIITHLPAELSTRTDTLVALANGATPAQILYAHAAGIAMRGYSLLVEAGASHEHILKVHELGISLESYCRAYEQGIPLDDLLALGDNDLVVDYVYSRIEGASHQDLLVIKDLYDGPLTDYGDLVG